MLYSYVVVAIGEANVKEMVLQLGDFHDLHCAGTAVTNDDAIDLILELQPQLVFLELSPQAVSISLRLIAELHRYINLMPHFIIVAEGESLAYDAIKAGASDYLKIPVLSSELRKSLLRFKKTVMFNNRFVSNELTALEDDKDNEQEIFPQTEAQRSEIDIQICIKSYGDYQFIALKDVLYLKADNNTTDFYLMNGKKLTAYKTLKHYENNLPSFFFRIHNSYIVNSNHVSRINTGKQLCYLNNNEISVSFSKTFKDNIDTIIRHIAPEYL